eukprot:120953-Ditylum_brightwellii.AAC.1
MMNSEAGKPEDSPALLNGAICSVCKFLRNVMAPTTKAKVEALFINVKKVKELYTALEEMGHKQPKTHHGIQHNNKWDCE